MRRQKKPQAPVTSMPDLDGLDSLTAQLIVVLLGGFDSIYSPKTRLYLRTLIRLVDRAVAEYKAGRKCLIKQIASEAKPASGLVLSFSFIDHMENCIVLTRRLFRIVERIERCELNLISRDVRRFLKSLEREITEVRGIIEHVDEYIHNDTIEHDQPVLLNLSSTKDVVSIGSQHLRLDILGLALRKMHQLAQSLLDATPQRS